MNIKTYLTIKKDTIIQESKAIKKIDNKIRFMMIFLEITIPFVKDILPYRIHYSTALVKIGKLIMAYGLATLVVVLKK